MWIHNLEVPLVHAAGALIPLKVESMSLAMVMLLKPGTQTHRRPIYCRSSSFCSLGPVQPCRFVYCLFGSIVGQAAAGIIRSSIIGPLRYSRTYSYQPGVSQASPIPRSLRPAVQQLSSSTRRDGVLFMRPFFVQDPVPKRRDGLP